MTTLSAWPRNRMNNYKRILIVRTDRIGDVILTTPAIETVRKNFPDARISVLVAAQTQDLVRGNPFIDEVLIDDREGRHQGMSGFWVLSSEIHARRFDVVFIFHTKKRTNFACFNARIPERIGYKDKNYGFFLTQGFPDTRHTGEKHESEYCLDLLRMAGLRVESPQTYLPYHPEAERWADEWMAKHGLSDGQKVVVIHPGASDVTKCWPPSSFTQLMDRLSAQGCPVVVIGHGDTSHITQYLRQTVKSPFFDLTNQTSMAQMASLLKRSHLLISNDSGPVHVAAAAGIYVISLFLRNQPGINPERWRPLGPKGFLLTNKPDEVVKLNASGAIASGLKDSIAVSDVFDLAQDLLQKL
jgi:heptosyltransferase-2